MDVRELNPNDHEDMLIIRVLAVESRLRLLSLLVEHGPLTINTIAEKYTEKFGETLTPGSVSQLIRRLEEIGVVKKERQGTSKVCSAIYSSILIKLG